MRRSLLTRAGIVAGACALVGAGAGIAGTAASPSGTHLKAGPAQTARDLRGPGGGFEREHRGGPPVHAQLVVLNKARDGFITVTADNGTVKSVSGQDVTITEAAGSVTYKDVKLTVPEKATVYRNGSAAKFGDLRTGDRVHVSQSSEGTTVFAADAQHQRGGPDGFHHEFHHDHHDGDGPPPRGLGG